MPPPEGSEELVGAEHDGSGFPPPNPLEGNARLVDWLTIVGERAGDVLVYSSAYLAFIAMAEVAIAMVILSLPPSPAPIVIGLVTLAIYATDHLKDDPEESDRAAFVNRYEEWFYLLAAIAYGLAIMISVLGGPDAVVITILPGIFWIVYASGQVPWFGFQLRRLKETLLVNTTIVALAWATSLTFLPLAFADRAVTPLALVVFGYFFLRSSVDTMVPNIRDMEADRAAGVATLPVVFGSARTRQIIHGIDGCTMLLIGLSVWVGMVPLGIAAALSIGTIYSLVVTGLLGRLDDQELIATATELEYMVVGLALIPIIYGL